MTNATQQDKNFTKWMRDLESTDRVDDEVKGRFLKELRDTRHVIIVDARQFHSDKSDTTYPFMLCTKESPLTLQLDAYPEVSDAVRFCKDLGMTWDLHLYPVISQRIQ